jgi:transposase-like protein
MGIMNELKNRGVRDILLAAVDGLTGFPGAIADVFPKAEVQLCMRTLVRVHMVRNSLRFVPYKDRKAVYTTNAVEPVNYTIQKIIKHRRSFPNDEAAMKLIFMGLKNISGKWTMPIRDWGTALNQFAIIYGEDRVPL